MVFNTITVSINQMAAAADQHAHTANSGILPTRQLINMDKQ